MRVQLLGETGLRKGKRIYGFLVTIHKGFDTIKQGDKKVVLIGGASECGLQAEYLLSKKGLNEFIFADNNKTIQGEIVRGIEVKSVYDLMKKHEDYYFIITVNNININTVRLQLMTHNIEDYGIFFTSIYHDFSKEDNDLQKKVLGFINKICFESETVESAMPYVGISVGGDGAQLGNLNWLLKSTTWSHPAYVWGKEYLNKGISKVLEIGPGFGLMAGVLLSQSDNMEYDLLIFGIKGTNSNKYENDHYWKGLKKIVNGQKNNKVNVLIGQIEIDDVIFEKNCKYNMVIMTEVFEHFALNPINTMKKISKVLDKNGVIVLTTPNWGKLNVYEDWRELNDNVEMEEYLRLIKCGHTYQYSKDELFEIFDNSGLKILQYGLSESNNHNFILALCD